MNEETKRKLEELKERISKDEKDKSADVEQREREKAETEATAQRAAAPFKEEIKKLIDEFEPEWKELPPLDSEIAHQFYNTIGERYYIVATQDKRILCRGCNIFQTTDLLLLRRFRDALEPFIGEIIETHTKQYEKQLKKT